MFRNFMSNARARASLFGGKPPLSGLKMRKALAREIKEERESEKSLIHAAATRWK